MITVPVASHTGFNPRHEDTGGAGQLLEYIGSTVPLPADKAAREGTGDPRSSMAERYNSRDDYLAQVRAAAKALAEQRAILSHDIGLCIEIAAARYDAYMEIMRRTSNNLDGKAMADDPTDADSI